MTDSQGQTAAELTEQVVRVLDAAHATAAMADEARRRAYGAGQFHAVEFFRSAQEREQETIDEGKRLLAKCLERENEPADGSEPASRPLR